MAFQKRKEDVLGSKKNCPDFYPCPLCFGCRNYDASYHKCQECGENPKFICDKKKHSDKALSMMIKPPTVVLDQKE